MEEPRIVRHGDKEVVMFTTPSGVHAIVATCIPDEALAMLVRKLKRKMRRRELQKARAVLQTARTQARRRPGRSLNGPSSRVATGQPDLARDRLKA